MSIHVNSWDSSRFSFFVTNILLDWSQSVQTCESKWRRPELLWNRFCLVSSLHPYTITHKHKTMGARARLTHPHVCVLGLRVITQYPLIYDEWFHCESLDRHGAGSGFCTGRVIQMAPVALPLKPLSCRLLMIKTRLSACASTYWFL